MYEKLLEVLEFVETVNGDYTVETGEVIPDMTVETGEVIPDMTVEEFNKLKEYVKSRV